MNNNEKLKEAKRLYKTATPDQKYVLESLFPKLKESEDERIRKAVIEMIHDTPNIECEENYNVRKEDVLAWLEKQGDVSKKVTYTQEVEVGNGSIKALVTGEIPIDKVEPKFKEGDWVVDNHGKVNQVTSVTDDSYAFTLYDGTYVSGCWKDYYHLWTIQDANDGDVLACNTNIFIYQKLDEYNIVKSFCDYHKQYGFNGIKDSIANRNECKPATKEQRDLLFQKMKEAGYEWDADKKELKKTRKPLYGRGDIIEYRGCPYFIEEVVTPKENIFYYNVVSLCFGETSRRISIGAEGEKDIILISNNRFDYEHANIQQKDFSPKASTANRQLYNRAILKILSDYVEKYPDIRFGQMLCNLDINPHFDEESRETYCNLNEIINKQK